MSKAPGPKAASERNTTGGARLLQGTAIAAEMRKRIKTDVAGFKRKHGFVPALAVIIVGRDAPSAVYLHQIVRSCRSVGVPGRVVELTGRATAAQLRRRIEELNADPLVGGIIVQMPLPRTIPLRAVIDTIHPGKDIDGIHPLNAGLLTLGYQGFHPACAEAAVEILKRSGYQLAGLHAVVIGRSNVVGKPAELLLLREHCTVTVCHRRTRDLAGEVSRADLLVVGAGSPAWCAGTCSSPARWWWTWASTSPPTGWSGTSTSSPRARWPAPSRRCRAASVP